MISIKDPKDCCGCSVCVQTCPKHCIKLAEDAEGFLYPTVDNDTCVKCGKCDIACPMQHTNKPQVPLETYAATNPNEYVRSQSSSGGIFSILAEYVIRQGGIVFGAAFNGNWEVVHSHTESMEGLAKFRGSKYAQSQIRDSSSDAERFLKEGRLVLFSGTPCQIAGLKRYLRKEYDNLLAVDCVCHGVPSPGIFRDYLGSVSRPITKVNFRDKRTGWKHYSITVKSESSELSEVYHDNDYMQGFLSNLYLRPSCYDCHFRKGSSGSDITLGDFWGIDKIRPELDDDKGLSLVIVNNERAVDLLSTLDCNLAEMQLSDAIKYNPSITTSVSIPKYRRLFFWTRKHFGLKPAIRLCCGTSITSRTVRKISKMFV